MSIDKSLKAEMFIDKYSLSRALFISRKLGIVHLFYNNRELNDRDSLFVNYKNVPETIKSTQIHDIHIYQSSMTHYTSKQSVLITS